MANPTRRRPGMDQSTDARDDLFSGQLPGMDGVVPSADPKPGGMPGSPGNPNTGVAGVPPPAPPLPNVPIVSPTPDVKKRTSSTTLMEGDPSKLGNQAHIAKSPKYQFLSRASQYGRGQEGDLLNSLKADYGDYWNGWSFDGKGNFVQDGSTPLHDAWQGVRRVDAYGGYNGGGDLRARWGVEDPNAPQGPQVAPRGLPGPAPGPGPSLRAGGPGGAPSGPQGAPGPQVEDPSGPAQGGSRKAIDDLIASLMNGQQNKKIVERRVDGARDTLNKQRKSSVDTLGAALAERGQLGSGAGDNAAVRLDESLGDDFAGAVSDIYADESGRADDRMSRALASATGLSIADMENALGVKNSDRNFELGGRKIDLESQLGHGDLDVRRRGIEENARRNDMDYSLGRRQIDSTSQLGNRGYDIQETGQRLGWDQFLAEHGLDRERLMNDMENGDSDRIIKLLELYLGGANTSADGYI